MTATPLGPARPFRFGVACKVARPRAEWVEFARRIEALGFSTLSLTDHTRPQFGLFPALQCAADATSTLRVGTLVANTDFRNPVLFARDAATLDLLSDGRFELGVGAGWLRRDYWESSLIWHRGADRVARFEEYLEILDRTLAGGEAVSLDGRWYQVRDLQAGPVPVQKPLPVMIGAGGDQMLRVAARRATIVSLARSSAAGPTWSDAARDATAASTASKVETLVEAAGARCRDIEVHVFAAGVAVGEDHAAAEIARRCSEFGLSPDEVRETPQHLFGDVEFLVDALLERRRRFGISYVTISEEALDDVVPIVERLAGR